MSADRYSSELIQEVRKLSSIEHPFTVTKPGTSHGREAQFVPIVNSYDGVIGITVSAELLESSDIVQYLWAVDQDDTVISVIKLLEGEKPQLDFTVPDQVTSITAYGAYSKYGVWASEPIMLGKVSNTNTYT